MRNSIRAISKKKTDWIVYAGAIFFAVYFALLSINRMYTLHANYYDLGIMDQTVYNTSQGHFLELTNPHVDHNTSRMAIHFDPALAFFAPFYWIFPSPVVLLVAQAFLLAAGTVAVYYIGKHLIKNDGISAVFAFGYLFFYPVQRSVIFDFHAVVLATPLLLFAILAELKGKHLPMLILIFLSLLTKEHVGLTVFVYGLYLMISRKKIKYGAIAAFMGMVVFVLAVKVVIPHYNQGNHFAIKFFSELGSTPLEVVFAIIRRPQYIFEKILRYDELRYLTSILAPSIVLLIFAPFEAAAILPELAMNVLSTNGNMRAIYYHYNAVLTPFLFFAAIAGFTRIYRVNKYRRISHVVLILYVILSLISVYWHDPLPTKLVHEPFYFGKINEKKLAIIVHWQNLLKDENIPVSTTARIAPFFTQRRYFYDFLYDTGFEGAGMSESDIIVDKGIYRKANYVILEKIESRAKDRLTQAFYGDLLRNPDFELIYEDGDFEIYKKI